MLATPVGKVSPLRESKATTETALDLNLLLRCDLWVIKPSIKVCWCGRPKLPLKSVMKKSLSNHPLPTPLSPSHSTSSPPVAASIGAAGSPYRACVLSEFAELIVLFSSVLYWLLVALNSWPFGHWELEWKRQNHMCLLPIMPQHSRPTVFVFDTLGQSVVELMVATETLISKLVTIPFIFLPKVNHVKERVLDALTKVAVVNQTK